MKGLWGRKDISIKCKKTPFIGKVYNNIISGMEAEAPRWNEVEQMDKVIMGMMRTIVGTDGIEDREDGTKRKKTNKEIRRMMGVGNIADEMAHRRLIFFQRIIIDEEQNVQVVAAVFGNLSILGERNIECSRQVLMQKSK